jgi:hypothetical protein
MKSAGYTSSMPRFVLLFHDCPPSEPGRLGPGAPSHWDLMLELDGALMTWNLAELPPNWQTPSDQDAIELKATRLPSRRLAYLEYEGPVSNNRGHVTRIDRGDYEIAGESPAWLEVRLAGNIARGTVRLPIAPPSQDAPTPSS